LQSREFAAEDADGQDEVQLAQDGAEDGQAREDAGRDEGVSADADVECAWLALSTYWTSDPQVLLRWCWGGVDAGASRKKGFVELNLRGRQTYRRELRRSNGPGRGAR